MFITDDELNICDFSKNFLDYTGITMDKILNNEEMTGKKENLQNFILDIHNFMAQDFAGTNLVPTKGSTGLVNKLI